MKTAAPALAALTLALAPLASLADVPMPPLPDPRGAISGSWYNPGQSGHGLHIERLEGGRVALSWYTYTADGRPLWVVGSGEQRGHRIVALAYKASGGRPPPLWDSAAPQLELWGELRIDFDGCNSGLLHWNTADHAFGQGSLPIQRLTRIEGLRCNAENEFGQQIAFSFQRSTMGFAPIFADLPQDANETYEIESAWERLPAPLESRVGIRLTGHNRSDDLAMLIARPIAGLEPNALYRVELEAELASNVPQGCAGVGGSPGESVYLKLGVSSIAPAALPVQEGPETMLRLNIDYGVQSQDGADAIVVGDMTTGAPASQCPQSDWELKTISTHGRHFGGRTDAQGRLWVLAGTDSAFEGLSTVYFTGLRVRLQAVAEGL
jgi:hypothetical protein